MTRSGNRDKTGVIDIGRKSLDCAGVAILGTGIMTAVFHWYGTAPDVCDWWNSRASGAAKIAAPSRRNQACIRSRPVAVGRSVSNIRKTSYSVMRRRSSCAVSFSISTEYYQAPCSFMSLIFYMHEQCVFLL